MKCFKSEECGLLCFAHFLSISANADAPQLIFEYLFTRQSFASPKRANLCLNEFGFTVIEKNGFDFGAHHDPAIGIAFTEFLTLRMHQNATLFALPRAIT